MERIKISTENIAERFSKLPIYHLAKSFCDELSKIDENELRQELTLVKRTIRAKTDIDVSEDDRMVLFVAEVIHDSLDSEFGTFEVTL